MATYDGDFFAWANEQAALLRTGRLHEADLANIAEEIESMGRSERRELVNRLAILLAHLLKWQVQPGLRSRSWRLTIQEQRRRLASHLADNPSLRARLDDTLAEAFELALIAAQRETGLDRDAFPPVNPYPGAQALDPEFHPA